MLPSTSSRSRRLGIAAVTLAILAGTPATAMATDHHGRGMGHILACFQLMMTDAAAHDAQCSPNSQNPFAGLPETGGRGVHRVFGTPISHEVDTPPPSDDEPDPHCNGDICHS